jgi:hypothetical protein
LPGVFAPDALGVRPVPDPEQRRFFFLHKQLQFFVYDRGRGTILAAAGAEGVVS